MLVTSSGRRAVLVLIVTVLATARVIAGGSTEVEEHDSHIQRIVPDQAPRLSVVASTNIVGDVVRQVVGDAADLAVLMEIGQNPHAWEPTPRAIGRIEDAHIVFINGVGLEESLLGIIDSIDVGYVVEVSEGIEIHGGDLEHDGNHEGETHEGEDHDDDHEEERHRHEAGDPHVWFDPNNVLVWVDNIEEALTLADPDNAAVYRVNADRYREELVALDREIVAAVATIPAERRKLVIDHVALGYFAERYGFESLGTVIPTVTDQAEPSSRDIARLVETIDREEIAAVFVGGTASRGLRSMTEMVAAEVGRLIEVRELLTGSLTATAPGDTYLGFVRYNTRQIVEGLSN